MSKRPKKPIRPAQGGAADDQRPTAGLRIVGGRFRGRRLLYSGDLRTRPMKDRLREAVFNLIGPTIKGKHALDLFAGTGALALEAVSRGAVRATLIEQHHPTAALIRQNIATLEISDRAEVVAANTFLWPVLERKRNLPGSPFASDVPWAVFCSPPYAFYVDRADEMLALIGDLVAAAPAKSVFVVEADARFDFKLLPQPEQWDVREYPPAVVGVWVKG